MTPKQVARSLVKYSQKYPDVNMTAFVIPQVPGTIPRSHPVDGVAESLVKSKKYLIPMTIIAPELTGGVVVAYLTDGRLKLPKGTPVFNIGDEENTGQPAAEPAREPLTPAANPVPTAASPATASPTTASPATAPPTTASPTTASPTASL
jgi:hypothetical protein